MSFTSETKNELCSEKKKKEIRACCKDALLHGMLLGAREYSAEKIYFMSESEQCVRYFISLIKVKYKKNIPFERENLAGHKMYSCACADRALLDAIHGDFDLFTEPRRLNEQIIYACDKCSSYFLRGLFLARGHIGEPGGENRLEINIPGEALGEDIDGLLSMIMLPPCKSLHRGKPVLLYKKGESIENFLGFIGADAAVLELINEKLVKDLRNNTNRRANVEAAGISRTVNAKVKSVSAIKKITELGLTGMLPEELRETARLRIENESLTLSELAAKHEPPITKSGVNHRLTKIIEFADKYGK